MQRPLHIFSEITYNKAYIRNRFLILQAISLFVNIPQIRLLYRID